MTSNPSITSGVPSSEVAAGATQPARVTHAPATPLPWDTRRAKRGGDVAIIATNLMAIDGRAAILAECYEDITYANEGNGWGSSTNASFIVHACNNYGRLVEALRRAARFMDHAVDHCDHDITRGNLRAAEIACERILRELGEIA